MSWRPMPPPAGRSTASTPVSARSPTWRFPGSTRAAAAQPGAQSRRRRRRRRSPTPEVRALMALRANVLAKGYSGIRARHARCAGRASQCRRPSGRSLARIGRRERRPGTAGASGARADRRRPRRISGHGADGQRGAGARRLAACLTRSQGRPRAHQRHAGQCRGARPVRACRRAPRAGCRHRPLR